MPISDVKVRLIMVCLSGFELFSRWVPLGFACETFKIAHCRTCVLQLRRNELKCGFYRQNPAYCSRIYLLILHK